MSTWFYDPKSGKELMLGSAEGDSAWNALYGTGSGSSASNPNTSSGTWASSVTKGKSGNPADALFATGKQASSIADPWASQRGQYQTKLSSLVNDPGGAMQNDPFFQWQQKLGEGAVNRAAAAHGQLGSGNRMTALSDYAQKQGGEQYFKQADLLSLLAGAKNQNPAAAGQLLLEGAKTAADYPLEVQKTQAATTSANTPLTLADLSRQGMEDALNKQSQESFWRRIGYFY